MKYINTNILYNIVQVLCCKILIKFKVTILIICKNSNGGVQL